MRIVYCTDSYGAGGVQQITVLKANALAEVEGYEVWIVFTDPPAEGAYHFPSEKVRLVDLGIHYRDNNLPFPRNVLKFRRDGRIHKERLARSLEEIRPDIVISTGQKEKYFICSLKRDWSLIRELHVSKGTRRIRAVSLRDRILSPVQDWMEFRRLLQRYDRLVVLTECEKEAAWGGDGRVAVIPNPLRFSRAEASPLDRKRLIAVGRLDFGKNYASLVRAFSKVAGRFPDWTLHICGEGQQKEDLQAMIHRLGLSGRVFLEGFVPDLEVPLLRSSIFVHTSLYETFGMVLVEAMGSGVPVVAYDCPFGPRSLISDGTDGFLVPLGDEDALAGRICELIADEALRRKMGAAALKKAEEYGIDRVIGQWTGLFEQLRSGRG